MSVTNIECQLAKGQIGRYLAGDTLSPEALRQLEAHIGECPSCKAALFERKAVLQLMLGQETPSKAVIETEVPDPVVEREARMPNPMAQALREHAEAEKRKGKPKPVAIDQKKTFSKPLLLSCALAGILMAMSYLSKTEMSPFGPKAFQLMSPAVKPNPVSTQSTATVEKPIQVAPKPASYMPKPVPSTPVVETTPAPSAATTQTPTSVPGPVATNTPVVKPTPAANTPKPAPVTPKPTTPTPTPAATKTALTVKAQPVAKVSAAPHASRKVASRKAKAHKRHLRRGTGTVKVYR